MALISLILKVHPWPVWQSSGGEGCVGAMGLQAVRPAVMNAKVDDWTEV